MANHYRKYIWLFAVASISSLIVLVAIFERFELIRHSQLCMATSSYVITDQIVNGMTLFFRSTIIFVHCCHLPVD